MATYSRKRQRLCLPYESPSPSPSPIKAISGASEESLPLQSRALNPQLRPQSTAVSTTKSDQSLRDDTPPTRKRKLVQTVLDLGRNPRRRCKECNMEYIPSLVEDSLLHKTFHDQVTKGIEVSAAALRGGRAVWQGYSFTTTPRLLPRPGNKRARRHVPDPLGENKDANTILEVSGESSTAARNLAAQAVAWAEQELGAVPTPQASLWEPVTKEILDANQVKHLSGRIASHTRERSPEAFLLPTPPLSSSPAPAYEKTNDETESLVADPSSGNPFSDGKTPSNIVDLDPAPYSGHPIARYKVYLYVSQHRVQGICLAERIQHGYRVLDSPSQRLSTSTLDQSQSQTDADSRDVSAPLCHEPAMSRAAVGISRIYVLPPSRNRGIAGKLLEQTCRCFLNPAPCLDSERGNVTSKWQISEDDVAFSQPTDSGRRLAEAWYRRKNKKLGLSRGWMVYDEACCLGLKSGDAVNKRP